MIFRATPFVLLLAASLACGANPTEPEPIDLDREFTLAPEERAAASDDSLEIRFIGVTEDSRCPSDVTCIWAGEVKIRIALRAGSMQEEREVRAGDSTRAGDRTITVVGVSPYPSTKSTIEKKDYRATFKVAR